MSKAIKTTILIYELRAQKELWLDAPSDGQTLLDYETTNKYLITCTAYDGFLYSEGDVLTLYVDNVNEPPVFDQPLYFCTMYEPRLFASSSGVPPRSWVESTEGSKAGAIFMHDDGDEDDGNNSERFRYDRVSNRLTFSGDYDVDNNNMPTTATITIYAVDSHRATGSAEIQVNVLDANDNTCLDGESAVKQYSISQFTPVKTLGYFRAEDDDLTSPNNKLTYQVISALPSSAVNYISVFGNGQIKYISLIPESEDGKSYTLVVRCRDGGSPSLSATGTVQVSYVKTVTPTVATTTAITPTGTTTTTETPNSGGDDDDVWDDSFVALFVVLMVLLAIVVAAAVWFLCTRYNLGCVRKAS
nr:hypothetical protein BaRGS_012053 [Batillaria attramentaria]